MESKENDNSKGSDDVLVIDAPYHGIEAKTFDVVLSDVTSGKLHGEVAMMLGVEYLSVVPKEDVFELLHQKTFYGVKYGPYSRFMINLPCRLVSKRNHGTSPKQPLPFHNIIFLVHTGSPYTYLCQEAMETLLGENGGHAVPPMLNVELSSGLKLHFHLSPKSGHFADVNVLGGSAFFSSVGMISLANKTGFTLTFD